MKKPGLPAKQGLYNPRHERDACGIGFVVNIKGEKSHHLVQQALEVLCNLDHRGARGCESNTGDGAGILVQTPHTFFQAVSSECGIDLPDFTQYGVAMVFLPSQKEQITSFKACFEAIVRAEGQHVLGWRTVPTCNDSLGATAQVGEPTVSQLFIGRDPELVDDLAFERKLYVIRHLADKALRYGDLEGKEFFYIPSLSYKTVVYKGMLTPDQVGHYYPDLTDPRFSSALGLVHSRFSTNTFPTWERSHPYRYIIHNGEINTLRGNQNAMFARQALLASELFGEDVKKLFPIIQDDGSDSAKFDNCLEFLALSGHSMAHTMMMMIPEPWENHETMDDPKKAFYEYHSCLMEPWDGPASIAFTDGFTVGAVLDRNGLRPSRYYVTHDDLVIMGSEVGVLEVEPERIAQKGRLEPGRMFLVDTQEQRIISDTELKTQTASQKPYRAWLEEHLINLEDVPAVPYTKPTTTHAEIMQRQQAFGYTYEDLRVFLGPMVKVGKDPVGSMGNDAPLAVLSDKPHLLYNYFKQLFAQVTNPPLDPIREEMVTSTDVTIGSESNLIQPTPTSCRQIRLPHPLLKNAELEKLRQLESPHFSTTVLPILYAAGSGATGLSQAMDTLCTSADAAIANGTNILILSDRGLDRDHVPIPALLAVAGLHHHLIRQGSRTRTGLILESGEPREVHHFCLLLGYGAQGINPYMAYEGLDDMINEGMLTGYSYDEAVEGYIKAAIKGTVKVMSKMGISTIKSYRGGQIFEAIGINHEVIDQYFTWTDSRVEGIGLEVIAAEAEARHRKAFPEISENERTLDAGGQFQWRRHDEHHLFNPMTVHKLQRAARDNDYEIYKEYAELINDQSEKMATLRSLLDFKDNAEPIPLDEVESVDAIVQRFKTGAMSYGSISKEAHEALAIAMNRLGGRSNTGEGGEDPERYIPMANGDSKNSAIKQVASGRFGVTSNYLVHAQELQIKMAQGAKPGEGGELPGKKVYPWIAKVRSSTPGVELISPPPHHDIYSIEDLAQLIHDLKNSNHQARINVKLVSEVGVGVIAAGVAKGHADVVLISGHDGGTGASPQTSIKHAGLPWELGVAETHQVLVMNDLRSRIVVETDGQLKTGRDVVIAALLGAEEFGFATSGLVAMGCIMMRVCHLDTCPVGVATQNPELRKKFMGSPDYIVNFLRFIAQDMREIMAQLGFRTIEEMVGRVDHLEPKKAIDHWKAKGIDLTALLHQPDVGPEIGRYNQIPQDHGLDQALDNTTLMELCKPALDHGEPVHATVAIQNVNRVVGTILGSEVTRRTGPDGLPDGTINLHFQGSAGQSFGAFVPPGITLQLEGDANDYFGKGLSGGRLVLYPHKNSTFEAATNVIVGNVAFYGASRGEAYINGMAGERFCVRNSGVHAVVEAVGDHGCEYMTGGRVVILGPTGRNFGAGMSGGIAYVLNEAGDFHIHFNSELADMGPLEDPEEINVLKTMIERHAQYTNSAVAQRVLDTWDTTLEHFVKVMPRDYKRILEALDRAHASGLEGDDAMLSAFQEGVATTA